MTKKVLDGSLKDMSAPVSLLPMKVERLSSTSAILSEKNRLFAPRWYISFLEELLCLERSFLLGGHKNAYLVTTSWDS